jgi:hypothetical protein
MRTEYEIIVDEVCIHPIPNAGNELRSKPKSFHVAVDLEDEKATITCLKTGVELATAELERVLWVIRVGEEERKGFPTKEADVSKVLAEVALQTLVESTTLEKFYHSTSLSHIQNMFWQYHIDLLYEQRESHAEWALENFYSRSAFSPPFTRDSLVKAACMSTSLIDLEKSLSEFRAIHHLMEKVRESSSRTPYRDFAHEAIKSVLFSTHTLLTSNQPNTDVEELRLDAYLAQISNLEPKQEDLP